ncbi:MAG: lipopolysaccharide biosynthesis protein [Acidimicrobiales bacterium]
MIARAGVLWRKAWHAFDGLAADTLWSGVHDLAQLVTALTSFVLLQRAYPDAAGVKTYGAYAGLYGLLAIFGALSYSGIGLSLLQRLLGEGDERNGALRSFLPLALLIGGGASAVTIALAASYLQLTVTEIAVVVVAELIGVATVWMSAMLVQAASGFQAAVRVKIVVIVLRFAIVTGLHATGYLTIRNLGIGFLVSFLVYDAYLLRWHLPRHGYRVRIGRPSAVAVRSSALFAVPMGAARLQTDADKFLLNVFPRGNDAGLYGAAYRILALGVLPLQALDTAAFQRFLPKGEGERGLHWRRGTRLALLMFGASLVVAAALYVILPHLDFLFQAEYLSAKDEIAPWLLLVIPLLATSNTPMNGLLGLGQADKRMYVYLSSAAVSMISYFVLIPPFSWQGAVAATLISEVYLSAAGWTALWYYQREADRALDAATTDPALAARV